MNFTTELPKRDPVVSYIVASAVKCEKFFPESANEGPAFRMHAVVLARGSPAVEALNLPACASEFILCHVRSVPPRRPSQVDLGPQTRRRLKTEDLSAHFGVMSPQLPAVASPFQG